MQHIRNPGFHGHQVCEFRFKNRSKKRSGNNPEKTRCLILGVQKPLKVAAQNGTKITYNTLPDHHVSPCCSRAPQVAPKVPKCSPGVPKWRRQAYQATCSGHAQSPARPPARQPIQQTKTWNKLSRGKPKGPTGGCPSSGASPQSRLESQNSASEHPALRL